MADSETKHDEYLWKLAQEYNQLQHSLEAIEASIAEEDAVFKFLSTRLQPIVCSEEELKKVRYFFDLGEVDGPPAKSQQEALVRIHHVTRQVQDEGTSTHAAIRGKQYRSGVTAVYTSGEPTDTDNEELLALRQEVNKWLVEKRELTATLQRYQGPKIGFTFASLGGSDGGKDGAAAKSSIMNRSSSDVTGKAEESFIHHLDHIEAQDSLEEIAESLKELETHLIPKYEKMCDTMAKLLSIPRYQKNSFSSVMSRDRTGRKKM